MPTETAVQNGGVHEVGFTELVMTAEHPFVRHQVDPRRLHGAWRMGGAVVLQSEFHLPGAEGRVVTALGPPGDVAALAAEVAPAIAQPWRVTAVAGAAAALPPEWQPVEPRAWHWMLAQSPPPLPASAGPEVVEVDDAAEVDAVLDAAQPDAHARPGTPGIECWLGVRDGARLVGVGALVRQPDRTGHLRAVSVLPTARGQGVGRAISHALTRRAFDGGSGVATLGVYADNAPAIALYRSLGYAVAHRFVSGAPRG